MANWFVVLSLIFLFGDSGFGANFRNSIKKCKVSPKLDGRPNECLVKAVNEAILALAADGSPELGVKELDPLYIKKMTIEKGGEGPVSISVQFTDNYVTGLNSTKVKSISGKLSSPKDFNMVMQFTAKNLQFVGPYKINGKVLILPISGEGTSNMKSSEIVGNISIKGEPLVKNGTEYLNIKKFYANVDTKRVYFDFQNLFNGQKDIGNTMNQFLNDNWEDITKELRSSMQNAFSLVFEKYSRNIFENIPFNEIFLLD